jgi:hypothetical protein
VILETETDSPVKRGEVDIPSGLQTNSIRNGQGRRERGVQSEPSDGFSQLRAKGSEVTVTDSGRVDHRPRHHLHSPREKRSNRH